MKQEGNDPNTKELKSLTNSRKKKKADEGWWDLWTHTENYRCQTGFGEPGWPNEWQEMPGRKTVVRREKRKLVKPEFLLSVDEKVQVARERNQVVGRERSIL